MSGELAGKLAIIKISGSPLSLAEEALSRISDTQWQISTAAKQVVDRDAAPVLEKYDDSEEIWEEIEYESVDKLTGIFTFAFPGYGSTEQLRVKSGNYLPLSTAAYAHDYTYNRGIDLHDVTSFREDYRRRLPGLKYASGTLSQWDVTDSYFADALTSGEPVVLELRGQAAGNPQRVWALIESDEMAAAVDSLQDEAVSFISTDELLNV